MNGRLAVQNEFLQYGYRNCDGIGTGNNYGRHSEFGDWSKKEVKSPAIVLVNPKFPRNVGEVRRSAYCFGVDEIYISGTRWRKRLDPNRMPREFRMKKYSSTKIISELLPLHNLNGVTPVAVEYGRGYEHLSSFKHPEEAVYVFGPEDGSLADRYWTSLCHRHVEIPTRTCLSLAHAVSVVLSDRMSKHREYFEDDR